MFPFLQPIANQGLTMAAGKDKFSWGRVVVGEHWLSRQELCKVHASA